jgi:dolichol-phosphate mannosyltransferase
MAPADDVQKGLVVIPTFNEAENITRLIPEVLRQDVRLEVLVVDDGSPDGTAGMVKGMMAGNPKIHLLERPSKMGLGTAYVAGFRYALPRGFDVVFEMDADFSHDPKELPNFLKAVETNDLVLGSRYTGGVRILNWPMKRLLLSYFANVYTRFMIGLPIADATGGFKCYRRAVLEAIDLASVRSNGYAFQIEMSFLAWKKGYRLTEIPIVFLDRQQGHSKMSKHIVYEAVLMLWKLRFRSLTGKL